MENYQVAIIGGGGAGQMAALRAVLNNLKTVIFTGDRNTNRKGRALWVSNVENMPGYFDKKKPIMQTSKETFEFLVNHPRLGEKFSLIEQSITHITKTHDGFVLTNDKIKIHAEYVVLCTGTMDVQPEIGGTIKTILPFANRGDVEYCIRCDGHKSIGKNVAIITNSNAGLHIATILKERYNLSEIHILTHGHEIQWSEEEQKLIKLYKFEVHTGEIENILGEAKTGLEGFQLSDRKIAVTKAFVAMGSIVYNDLAKQLGTKLDAREHITTNEKFETSVNGFYAVGDLVSGKKKQVYTAWDAAVDAIDHIDLRIRLDKRQKLLSQM